MAHIRVFRHYVHTPFLLMGLLEACAIALAAYTGFWTRHGYFPPIAANLPFAITLTVVLTFFMVAMGVYEARLREGYMGMMLRTAVAIFLLGTIGMAVMDLIIKELYESRGMLLLALIEAFIFIVFVRWATSALFNENLLKQRVLVFGAGARAERVASRMRRRSDRRAFVLLGFLPIVPGEDAVTAYGQRMLPAPNASLVDYCRDLDVDEIVVATDERRSASDSLDELMECRLSGIDVCEVQSFIEREASKIDIDLLQKSWLVYSDGFVSGGARAVTKRGFDIIAAVMILALSIPLWVLAALAVRIFDGRPVLYRQKRVGLHGKEFEVLKFRTMPEDAEESGAVWAENNDPRVSRLGRILRKSRIDELPQLINVLRGEMSMVGPRPERPVFVDHLSTHLPYYSQRHRVKPGITGWAQLCYPYGASVEDAKEKLQYDLYYLKNHSILLDMIIMLQTVEVVLVGEGAR